MDNVNLVKLAMKIGELKLGIDNAIKVQTIQVAVLKQFKKDEGNTAKLITTLKDLFVVLTDEIQELKNKEIN